MAEKFAAYGKPPVRATRRHHLMGCTLALVGAMACIAGADEKDQKGKSRDEALAALRFELMRKHVAAAKVESGERGFPRGFAPEPIFRYSDSTRGFVAGAVWKLGDEGRPKALLATELRRKIQGKGKPNISYEFSSLTTTPFSLRSEDMDWSPAGTRFEFKPIPKA